MSDSDNGAPGSAVLGVVPGVLTALLLPVSNSRCRRTRAACLASGSISILRPSVSSIQRIILFRHMTSPSSGNVPSNLDHIHLASSERNHPWFTRLP
eukprot:2059882-Amphidinium_carterae.4